ncbi:arylesterase [Frateuria aurantia]
MRVFLCMGLLLASWLAHAGAPAQPGVLVLGDSLSAAHNIPEQDGWVALLGQRLSKMRPAWQVVNASISGETSLSGRGHLPGLLARLHPAVVVIELGANDGLRGLPLPALQDNLTAMVKSARASGAKVLLLGIQLPVNFGPRYRDGLSRVYAEVAQAQGVALVPFMLDGVAQHLELMQQDGLHPLAQAEPKVLDNIWPALQPLLGRHPSPSRH